MNDCLFCRIASGEIPADFIHRDEDVLAFRDVDPQAPVHVLIIPRLHLAHVSDAESGHESLLGKLLLATAHVARSEGVAESGYRLVINNGADANQTVAHVHVHLLGGRTLAWPPG